MNKVFIAGGTGMLGANAARALAAAGTEVVVSTRKEVDPVGARLAEESALISVERVDLRDLAEVEAVFARHDFEGVVMAIHTHQYARTRDENNQIYPITIHCLETARKRGVRRVAIGGSMAVYGGPFRPSRSRRSFRPR